MSEPEYHVRTERWGRAVSGIPQRIRKAFQFCNEAHELSQDAAMSYATGRKPGDYCNCF